MPEPMRVVSLLPSATEIAIGLGLADQLVGVTFECDYPPDPRVGRSVVVGGLQTHGLDAGAIDALVRQKVAAGDDLYTLDVEAFRALDPTVVLTQDLCRVCALPSGRVDEAMAQLGCHAAVVTMDPHSVAEIFATILAVGAATGTLPRADEMVAQLTARLTAVAERVANVPRPRVFVLEWPDPPFVAGHWVPELVHAAGGDPVLARPGERSVPTTWDEVAQIDPDVVVVSSCGFDAQGSAAHAADVLERLPAKAQVWAIDANGLMVRPGPRVVDGVETLAAMFHGTVHAGADLEPSMAVRVR
jgi:iron complex transport system substrate-binding protein